MRPDGCTDIATAWQEFCFSQDELNILRGIVLDRLGISIGQEKDYLLASRFGKMLRFNNLQNAGELISMLRRMPENATKALAPFLTTGHTFFFREKTHFELLVKLLKRTGLHAPNIWCAASSSGEEIYTIAISLLEAGILDFTLIGSDINLDALKLCRRGIYAPQRILEIPPEVLKRYFRPIQQGENHRFQIIAEIRDRVILKRINLLDPYLWEQKMDVIFCRNVLIYFNETTQTKVLTGILRNLAPGGLLFLGHSEPLIGENYGLQALGPAIYQRGMKT